MEVLGCLLVFVCLPLFCTDAFGRSQQVKARPNVLFIAVDDLRPELGCYGVPEVQSPNIDRLADSGVVFQRAYCQLAVCNPSRVSIMTGLRPDSTKVWDLVTRFRHTIPDAVTLPQHFRKHGYYAVSFGKIFHNPWPDNESWSEPHAWPLKSSLWSKAARQRLTDYREQMRLQGRSEQQVARMRAQATEVVDLPDDQHIDGAIAEQTLAAMSQLVSQDQPFFLATGFVRPHLPFVVPRRYWDLYQRDLIPEAQNPFLPKGAPSFAMNTMYELRDYLDFAGTAGPGEGELSAEQRRRLKHGYYASVSFVDSLVGKLLDGLEEHGVAENTIVVLWGDHGWKLGEHNSWCKQSNYEIDTRVPLIVRAPGTAVPGASSSALVELVDVYPTLCELAGLPVPNLLEGVSAVPQLIDPRREGKTAAFSQFRRQDGDVPLMGYAMRTNRYRYVEWIDRRTRRIVATELYDHQTDAMEDTNIASDPEHHELLRSLSQQLWEQLPQPPPYEPESRQRPAVTFVNKGQHTMTLFWIRPDGTEHKVDVIPPGKEVVQQTTLGHRFRVRGPNGATKIFTIKRRRQTITIRSPQKEMSEKSIQRPNILVCMADDWSWPHAGVLGDPVVKTPHFDRVAREGVLFPNAFVSTPSCTPSRLSLLTGQHHWRLKEGASLGGSLREEFPVYTELLEQSGYHVGRYGKGVWPSEHRFRNRDSFGKRYATFAEFLDEKPTDTPFCYWHGGQDPHRPYECGAGQRSGINITDIAVPDCLPDHEIVRQDMADYLWEVQRFDREVGGLLAELDAIGELGNTIVVVSGDNGMPFPRCKATLYDQGTRVPLAIRWGAAVKAGRIVDDFVSLCDLAPTFLNAAGIDAPEVMTGVSLQPLLETPKSGQIDPSRDYVVCGLERHVYPTPSRALRTRNFLFLTNDSPHTWKTGEQHGMEQQYDFTKTPWPNKPGAFAFNIDPSPTKQLLRLHRNESDISRYASLAFGKHPTEELYDLRNDPAQVHNVATQASYAPDLIRLRRRLHSILKASDDPRFCAEAKLRAN